MRIGSLHKGMFRHVAVRGLSVMTLVLVTVPPVAAGESEKGIIERSLSEVGVEEGAAKQVSEIVDIALEGVREYLRGTVPKAGTPRSSTPNPVAPLVTLAANLDTITCSSTLATIRIVQRDMAMLLAREYRDATREEATLLRKLQAMHDALYIACNPEEQAGADDGEDETAIHTVAPQPDPEEDATGWTIPTNWTFDDYDCLRACATGHLNYTIRAEKVVPSVENAMRDAGRKLGNLSNAAMAAYEAGESECLSLLGPVHAQLQKLLGVYQEAKQNIEALDRYYQREVVDCVKRCPIRVQLVVNREYPETPEHVATREALLLFDPSALTGNPCGPLFGTLPTPLELPQLVPLPPAPVVNPLSGN